jgi:hypothetical protein
MSEEWRPVVGHEGLYSVSSWGRVRSEDRAVLVRKYEEPYLMSVPGRILFPGTDKYGYKRVSLHKNGIRSKRKIHHIVAEAFNGPRPTGLEVRHLDDCKSNNTPENLAYGTQSENQQDRRRNGVNPNLNKTRCKHNHEYSVENTRITKAGTRRCKICERETGRQQRIKRKQRAMVNN